MFRGLCFAVGAGEWVRITGPNGSGKTTLLRVLAGLTRPEFGAIEWVGGGALAEIRAYVGHAQGWKDTLSVTENLQLGWALDGEAAATDLIKTEAALGWAGLEAQRNLAIGRLSQGQKKRLHLARLSLSTKKLWLLDEPSADLDDKGCNVLTGLVSKHLRRGGIAVIATHQPLPIDAVRSHDVAFAG